MKVKMLILSVLLLVGCGRQITEEEAKSYMESVPKDKLYMQAVFWSPPTYVGYIETYETYIKLKKFEQ